MKLISKTICTSLLAFMLSTSASADCAYELFSISSTKNTKVIDFIEQLSDECGFSIIVTDPNAEEFLKTNLNKTNLNNLTIDEVLSIILKENNLTYKLENNILKISYLETKTYSIDYILSQRKSKGSTDITLSSNGATGAGAAGATGSAAGGATGATGATGGAGGTVASGGSSITNSGIKIESTDDVQFWHQLDLELQKVINTPQDKYKAEAPVINKNAGMITVTATGKQLERFEKYLKSMQDKVQTQVLIDVQLLAVTMTGGSTTGVDWSQLYALQNINLTVDKLFHKNVTEFADGKITTAVAGGGKSENSHLIEISAQGSLNEVIKFLKTQGDVTAISNPKVLTLNNQPALISAGTEFFYKIINTQTLSGGTSGAQSENEIIQSVFAGVLLDITPEISDNKTITLKVNPSLSETTTDMSATTAATRTMPPDLRRRQLSSVVTVKDGNRIILGGLINTSNDVRENKIPLLGDIPILGWLFKYEAKQRVTQELVIVIQPHIVDKNKNNVSLSELGFEGIGENVLKGSKEAIQELKHEKKD